jgi:hypothetical protein
MSAQTNLGSDIGSRGAIAITGAREVAQPAQTSPQQPTPPEEE